MEKSTLQIEIEPFEKAAIAHGWKQEVSEGETLWMHSDHPGYGYQDADELCEDWSYEVPA